MKLVVGIPALGQYETLKKNIKLLLENAKEKPEIIVFDNGSDTPIKRNNLWYTLKRSKKNLGVPQAMNQIMDMVEADYYMMIHSDVEIYEQDWDVKIVQMIEELQQAGQTPGVLGGFGSLQLGSNDIYQTQYAKGQLGRAYNIQGTKNRLGSEHGGKRFMQAYQPCITLDGYMLITHKDLRFWNNTPHHMYDHDICMESIDHGMTNWTINIDHMHEGGVSVTRENWTRDFKHDGDEIHDLSHTEFYKKWEGKLPQKHKNIFYY